MDSNKTIRIIIGIIILILIIIGIAYYVNSAPITTSPDPKQTLTALEQTLQVSAPITDKKHINWFDQNKQRIPLAGQSFVLGTEGNDYIGKYGTYPAGDINSVTEASFKTLQSSLDSFFTTSGFQKDNQNTLRSASPLYLTMGYAKENLYCLITLTPQTDPFGDFFCGTVDQEQIAWKKELTPAINPTNDPNVSVTVEKLIGNYATGGMGSYTNWGGVVWYAVKVNGKWEKVWEGQNTISCTPVNKYNIPKEIYGNDCSTTY